MKTIEELKIELIQKGQRIRELEKELKTVSHKWFRFYQSKDLRQRKK
jgi:hypothetical protein